MTENENETPAARHGAARVAEPNIRDMQTRIVRHAIHGERVFSRVLTTTTKSTPAQRELNLLAHAASLHGYALASVLGFLAGMHPDIAAEVAWMVDDMGMNGGAEWIAPEVFEAAMESLGDRGHVDPSSTEVPAEAATETAVA
jgi:hypothetical protein